MKFEVEGYAMTLYALSEFLRTEEANQELILQQLNHNADNINQKQFCGPGYYYMWPFGVRRKLATVIEQIRTDDISDGAYRVVSYAIRNSKT
jgi:hypothetical protein